MNKTSYQEAVYKRLADIFSAYKAGKDVSPAMRYRAEGFIEAAIEQGGLSHEELAQIHQQAFHAAYGDDMALDTEGCDIPAMMVKAPVKPTTKE